MLIRDFRARLRSRAQRFRHLTWRNAFWNFTVMRGYRELRRPEIIALVRIRNEGLLLQDTLDHLGQIADGIVVFDDASTDASVSIALRHPAVTRVIQNRRWRSQHRPWEEASNRAKLYAVARKLRPKWYLYADADERFSGDVRSEILGQPANVSALRMNLFDAYLTERDSAPYESGMQLLGFRKLFGPERRRILVAWRATNDVRYVLMDAREPQGIEGNIIDAIDCQHYGKGLSVEQWEDTCQYYIDHFPMYAEKWAARRGRAVHVESDFQRSLYPWAEVHAVAVDI